MFWRRETANDAGELVKLCEPLLNTNRPDDWEKAWKIAKASAERANWEKLGALQYVRLQAYKFYIHCECDYRLINFSATPERAIAFWLNYEFSTKCFRKLVEPQLPYISEDGWASSMPVDDEFVEAEEFNPYFVADAKIERTLHSLGKIIEKLLPGSRDAAWENEQIKQIWDAIAPTITRWKIV